MSEIHNIGSAGGKKITITNVSKQNIEHIMEIFSLQLYKISYKNLIGTGPRETVKKYTYDYFEHCRDTVKNY